MEFNKCSRCGNFYVSFGDVCPKCSTKDGVELSTFKTYIQENGLDGSLDSISSATGISIKNLNRFLNYDEFKGYKSEIETINLNMKKINLGNSGIIFN